MAVLKTTSPTASPRAPKPRRGRRCRPPAPAAPAATARVTVSAVRRRASPRAWTMRPPTSVSTARPRTARPANGVFCDFERKRARLAVPARSGSNNRHVGRRARARACPPGSPSDARRADGQQRDRAPAGRARPRRTSSSEAERQRRLEAEHAEGGVLELDLLLDAASAARGRWRWRRSCRRPAPRAAPRRRPACAAAGSLGVGVVAGRRPRRSACRWCGVTSQVTGSPRRLASRTRRTARRALETWATW